MFKYSKLTKFYFIITFLLVTQIVIGFDNLHFQYILLALVPLFAFLIFKKIFQKLNWNLKLTKVLKILGTILTLVFLFFLEIAILWEMPYVTTEPSLLQYGNSVNAFKKMYHDYDLSYFPSHIPDNATNYYFLIGAAFDGYNTYYVKYNINKAYIDELLEKYRGDFLLAGTKSELYDKDIKIYINDLNDTDKVYLLKRDFKKCKNCKSGFITRKNPNTIYFFFQNF